MSKLDTLNLGYYTLIFSAITGFAGYGLANAGGSNAKLAATIGVIYGLATCLIQPVLHFISPARTRAASIYRINMAKTAVEAILIVASRALGLFGSKGLACFAGIALTSHIIGRLNCAAVKQQAAEAKARKQAKQAV